MDEGRVQAPALRCGPNVAVFGRAPTSSGRGCGMATADGFRLASATARSQRRAGAQHAPKGGPLDLPHDAQAEPRYAQELFSYSSDDFLGNAAAQGTHICPQSLRGAAAARPLACSSLLQPRPAASAQLSPQGSGAAPGFTTTGSSTTSPMRRSSGPGSHAIPGQSHGDDHGRPHCAPLSAHSDGLSARGGAGVESPQRPGEDGLRTRGTCRGCRPCRCPRGGCSSPRGFLAFSFPWNAGGP